MSPADPYDESIEYYDSLYQDRDYDVESDHLERVFETHGDGQMTRILDVGCGTGKHLVELRERGFEGVGVDVSGPMLKQAESNLRAAGFTPELYQMSVENLDLDEEFDAVVCLFAVLDYLTTNAELAAGLSAVADHLRPDGLLVGEIWYGPAVVSIGPEPRLKRTETDDGELIRVAESELDDRNHVVRVDYDYVLAGEEVREFSETHVIRYLFPKELERYLDDAGFELVTMFDADDPDTDPGLDTWFVTFVARRK